MHLLVYKKYIIFNTIWKVFQLLLSFVTDSTLTLSALFPVLLTVGGKNLTQERRKWFSLISKKTLPKYNVYLDKD